MKKIHILFFFSQTVISQAQLLVLDGRIVRNLRYLIGK